MMKISIRRLVIEREAEADPAARGIISGIPEAAVSVVDDIMDHQSDDYSGILYLKRNRGRFIKDFPVSSSTPSSGEKYIITMLNCPFQCRYCYLQVYLDHCRMVVFTNTGQMKSELREVISGDSPERITSGEMGDSLALDHITGTTAGLLPLFAGTGTLFEARTKSSNVRHLLDESGAGCSPQDLENLLITWTMSPEAAARAAEPGCASIEERLEALKTVSRAGIKTAVRFDPVIPRFYSPRLYGELIGDILTASGGSIYRFELGVMRFPPGLWEHIRIKYPGSPVLKGEFTLADDGKIKYYRPGRLRIYRELSDMIKTNFPGSPVELCMEPESVWEDSGIPLPSQKPPK
ncbi:MAG: hypothetical protein R6U43_08760 [Candidatus Krumholzibacteriales bacterium]